MRAAERDCVERWYAVDGFDREMAALALLPRLVHRPFKRHKPALPPPPPLWRRGGATGAACAAPFARLDAASRLGYTAVYTHGLACVENGLRHVPAAFELTLHLQLGLSSARLPRNTLETLFTPGYAHGCRTLVMVTELNVASNRIKQLPHDFGLMADLVRLDVSGNCLDALPHSFERLTKLVRLDVSRNVFQLLPENICALGALEWLGAADNMLARLPATLPRLRALAFFDVSGNGLVHLGVEPPVGSARAKAGGADDWDARVAPRTGRAYFLHAATKRTQPTMPAALRRLNEVTAEVAAELLARPGPLRPERHLERQTAAYNQRRQLLSLRGVGEWSVKWVDATAACAYTSAVNGEVVLNDMPSTLDTFGRLLPLTELKLDNNQLHDLPPSLSLLTNLTKLRCRENFLRALPAGIGLLAKLKTLDVASNELSELPQSCGDLTALTRLSLQSNRFEELDPFVGNLTSLSRLLLGNNSLSTLPCELGFLTALVELQCFNNPLVDPPYEATADLQTLLWACRQKYWLRANGPLPVVEARRVGVMSEVLEAEPVYALRIARLVEDAAARLGGELLLQLEGVTEIPGAVRHRGVRGAADSWSHPALETLRSLKLTMNTFAAAPRFTNSLANLRVLWLKECHVSHLNDDVAELQGLEELDLELNSLNVLPQAFVRLRSLKRLNLAKNRLFDLPTRLGNLTALTVLDCAMNRLEAVPHSLTELRALTDLSLACNRLFELPTLWPGLSALTKLNVDANDLHKLPLRLGGLPLKALHASHNRLERLEDDALLPRAAETLEVLGLAANNLLELPSSLHEAARLRVLRVEYNPMRNPPAALLSEGRDVLVRYCRLREQRLAAVVKLIGDYKFDTEIGHLAPEAYDALTGRTGFLSPDDLGAFDRAIDGYLNGAYYTCVATDVEIMDRVDRLRSERQHAFFHALLQMFLDKLAAEAAQSINPKQRRFGPGVLRDDTRPWGRKGEQVNVHCLALDALVKDHPARGVFVTAHRPSVFATVKYALPPTVFDYTLEVLKDAIQKYEGAYGSVAHLDKVRYDRCECVDARGRSAAHRPCVLPSVVIVKVIVSPSEAQRRVAEDDMVSARWIEIWRDVDARLAKRQGRLTQANHVEFRRKECNATAQEKRLHALEAQKKCRALVEKHALTQRRRENFDKGDDFAFHRFASKEEADALCADVSNALDAAKARQKEAEKDSVLQMQQQKLPVRLQVQRATLDLKHKYCVLALEEVFDAERRRALKNEWRRPWDGSDGETYERWKQMHQVDLAVSDEATTLPPWVRFLQLGARKAPKKRRGDSDSDSETEDVDAGETEAERFAKAALQEFPYNWEGTNEMDQFSNDRYLDYEKECLVMSARADAKELAVGLREDEAEPAAA
ncbi:hypothetical protein M885DRAFT_537236 [Pelagophyceae sp. CCMP2097]|nr:hypothetical protein M885DRAFT_537236 [Pelagophyceae sp. CCMP2097]